MACHDLNETLGCLFLLSLLYLGRDYDELGLGAYESTDRYGAGLLDELEDCGLVWHSSQGEKTYLTREGLREARGVLKFLQLELGPRLGSSLEDIKLSDPELYAEEAASGAGPLTTTELVYALAGVAPRRGRVAPPTAPNMLESPPECYLRDTADRRSFQLRISLPLYLRGGFGRWERGCWRTVLVPAGLTFLDLHIVIQKVLNWNDARPFGFLLTHNKRNLLLGERQACGDVACPETRKKKIVEERASQLRLSEVLPKTRTIEYRYGCQDGWTLSVSLVSGERGLATLGPQLLDGVGDAPPEWMRSEREFLEFRDKLYADRRLLIRALAGLGEKDFLPFDHATTRQRLGEFEDARAEWQHRLDGTVAPCREEELVVGEDVAEEPYPDDIPL